MMLQAIPRRADDLARDVEALLPTPVTAVVTDPKMDYPVRFEEEAAAVDAACEKRQREFRAGRAAVGRAMRRMGLAEAPVPMGPDRAPVWPEPLTGSISHSDDLCIALLADRREVPSIGLDIEMSDPLDPALVPEVCTSAERAWLSHQPRHGRSRLAKLVFSAKECAYKCQYGLSRTFLEFHDLEITVDVETGQFEATFLDAVPGFNRGAQLFGRYMMTEGHVITAMAARREAGR